MKQFNFDSFDFKRNLILYWTPGIWKTYHAMKLYERFPWSEQTFQKYQISDAMFKQMTASNNLRLRDPIDWQTSYQYYPLEIMIRAQLLIYDDVWVSDSTEAYLRNITFVLDERIKRWLCTIFTTNLPWAELEKKLDQRVVSRIMYNADAVKMEGVDRRKQTTEKYEFHA